MVEIKAMEQFIWALWVITVCTVGNCSSPILIPAQTRSCICPQTELELNCTVIGTDNDRTVWAGSAIQHLCSSAGQNRQELSVPHRQFQNESSRYCGPMDMYTVVLRNFSVDGNCYTSQLTIKSISRELNGENVICRRYNGTHDSDIGNYTISLFKDPFPSPDDVNLTNMSSESLTFTWSNVATYCPAISYDIIAENCGSCPNETNLTTITCSYVQPDMQEVQCNLSVRSVTCGDIRGEYNIFFFSLIAVKEPVADQFDLRLLGLLSLLVVPLGCIYCCILLIIFKCYQDKRTHTYGDLEPIDKGEYKMLEVNDASELLQFLGNDNYRKGCAYYEFVNENEDIAKDDKIILVDKSSGKYFSGPAARKIINAPTNESSTSFSKPKLKKYSIFVQDNTPGHRFLPKGTYLLVENYSPGVEAQPEAPGRIIDTDELRRKYATEKDLDELNMNDYEVIEVDKDCGLLQFLTTKDPPIEFSRGCAYYEFKNVSEEISKDIQIVLMHKETKKLFTGIEARRIVGISNQVENDELLYLPKPNLQNFDVFLQDRGTGSRYLANKTRLIVWKKGCGLVEVPVERFIRLPVNKESELLTFIESQRLPYTRRCAFYEFSHKSEDISEDKEVLLMDVETKSLYTGVRAKIMIGAPGKGIRNPYSDKKRYRVFVQGSSTGHRHLDKNTLLLYEKSVSDAHRNPDRQPVRKLSIQPEFLVLLRKDQFEEIKVTENCQLTQFLGRNEKEYEGKCIYLEFIDKQDVCDKEILLMDKEGEIFTGKEITKIIGVPGTEIERPDIPGYPRIFVQCGDVPGDNIYVKRDTLMLYKKIEHQVQLQPVKAEEFYEYTIGKTCELSQFVIDNVGGFERGHAYFQFTCTSEDISIDKEVILKDKETKKLFTGAAACQMIGAPGKGIPRPSDSFKYKVFIQNKSRGSRCLIKGSELLYRKEPCQESSPL